MAKSFKQFPPLESSAAAKPMAERDFFDLLNEPTASPAAPAAQPSPLPPVGRREAPGNTGNPGPLPPSGPTSNTGTPDVPGNSPRKKRTRPVGQPGNPGNIRNPAGSTTTPGGGNPSNSRHTGNTPVAPAAMLAKAAGEGKDARQTFVLSRTHLERLRDHVHARRAQGDYTYSQKEALQTALDWLFAQGPPVAGRPDEVREREQQRGELIRKGRRPVG